MVDTTRSRLTEIRNFLLSLPGFGTRKRLECLAYASCFLFGFFLAWVGMQFQGTPEHTTPLTHARLLAAETFASGHLHNAADPGGFFLQTYLTLQSPTYSAAVHPGPALLLALGILCGDPLWALWISTGILSAATAWMIRGYASLRWAIVGSVIVSVWYGALSYWSQSFDGSLGVAIGIALIWGAARRYHARKSALDLVIFSVGLGWAFLCDPLATLFAALIPLFLCIRVWLKRRKYYQLAALLPGMILFAGVQLPLNQATTGHLLTSPTKLYAERYDPHPRFIWQMPASPKTFDFIRMEKYDSAVQLPASRLPNPVAKTWAKRIQETCAFYLSLPALVLIIGALWHGVTIWGRWMLWGSLGILFSIFIVLRFSLSNTAGLAVVATLLTIWSARLVWVTKERSGKDYWRPAGIFFATLLIATYVKGTGIPNDDTVNQHLKYKKELSAFLLKQDGDRHLVMVDYDRQVSPHVEYVYNTAKLDEQSIVWARVHDREDPKPLLNRFRDRKMWMLFVKPSGTPDLRPFKWVPDESGQAASPIPPQVSE